MKTGVQFLGAAVLFLTSEVVSAFKTAESISYVVEPFETTEKLELEGDGGLEEVISLSEDGLFGNSSLQVNFTVASNLSSASFGWTTSGGSAYHCLGADYMSIWYKVTDPKEQGEAPSSITVILGDDFGVTELDGLDWFSSKPSPVISNGDWNEVRIPFDDENWIQTDDSVGEGTMHLNHLREWKVQIDGSDDLVIRVDHLSCVGNGNMFASVFDTDLSFEIAAQNYSAFSGPYFHKSNISKESSTMELEDGVLTFGYTVEQTESWGGFSQFGHYAPSNAYYNLSQAKQLDLAYSVPVRASQLNRVHLRLTIAEVSECAHKVNCTDNEVYYSFAHVLDDVATETKHYFVTLKGDDQPTSSLYRTGWTGLPGVSKNY